MKKFEYQQIKYDSFPSVEELNKVGINGWEMIHVYTFKRKYFDAMLESYYTKEMCVVTFKREI
jgi:hypothetical protein